MNRIPAFDILRFPLVVFVAFIHSYNPALLNLGETATFIYRFLTGGLFSLAVPLFFFISGYLMFRDKWTLQSYGRQLTTRLWTIGVPYLFWLLFYYWLMFTAHFGIELYPPQFWFLHELIFLVVISPVFHILHYKRLTSLFILAVVWLFFDWSLSTIVLSSALPLLFFYMGSVVAVSGFKIPGNKYLLIGCGLVAAVLFAPGLSTMAHKVGVIIGLLTLLMLANRLSVMRCGAKIAGLGAASFFIFCSHQPLVQIVFAKMYAAADYPAEDVMIMLLYMASPAVVVSATLFVYSLLERNYPGFLRLINGGRVS